MSQSSSEQARARLREFLQRSRNGDGGWPFYRGRQSRLEPTAWAMLASGAPADSTPLPSWRRGDELLVEPATGAVNFAFNGVAALALAAQGASVAGLIDALSSVKGVKLPPHPMVRQDGSLQAWPWFEDTFSWVEPTAWCLLATKKLAGRQTRAARIAARVEEGERLLADRACPGGGWNYGNGLVYGKDLPAHVPATAAGVLAMQDLKDMAIVRGAIAFLEEHTKGEGSSAALALGWMALRVVGVSDSRLDEALAARAALAEEFGNVANAAMLLYALDCLAAGQPPKAFVLG